MSEIANHSQAARLVFGLLIGFALVVVHSSLSHGQRDRLETTAETTAVGDHALYPAGETAPPVSFGGKALLPVSPRPHELRESKATLAGQSDDQRFRIYTTRESLQPHEGDTERAGAPVYFLKTGTNQFLKFQPGS